MKIHLIEHHQYTYNIYTIQTFTLNKTVFKIFHYILSTYFFTESTQEAEKNTRRNACIKHENPFIDTLRFARWLFLLLLSVLSTNMLTLDVFMRRVQQ